MARCGYPSGWRLTELQRQFASLEVNLVPNFFAYHLTLDIPEERVEDHEKVLTTRYTPLGVVGAICPWYVCQGHTKQNAS